MKKHAHKCGWGSIIDYVLSTHDDRRLPDYAVGCGNKWEHERPPHNAPEEEYTAAHMCPRCGEGPWYTILESGESTSH